MPRTGSRRGTGRRWWGTGAALAVLLGLPVATSPGGAQTEDEAPAGPAQPATGPEGVLPPDESWTVTLVTGEVVDVRSDAEGRVSARVTEHEGPFRTLRKADGSMYVIPMDVTPLLDGVLDLELFDVTGLVQQGYDDESRDTIGLIVQREPGTDAAEVKAAFDSPGEQELPSIGAVALEVPKESADDVGEDMRVQSAEATPGETELFDGVTRVWLDGRVEVASPVASPARPGSSSAPQAQGQGEPDQDANLTQVGADVAWDAGLTGAGATVAVLDTGVDHDHPDIAGKVTAEESFIGTDDTVDRNGHGTHVAATAAGSGAGAGGARSGVAPEADLAVGKVLDDTGGGWESGVIAGMEWAAPQADVVNMSLGIPPFNDDDPLALAADQLTEAHGTLFVVAAGNSGPLSTTVESPGVADRALTVGAVDFDDEVAEFSSRGPVTGTYRLKPEIVAPGVDIVAARAAEARIGDPLDDHYLSLSGTSMATPHVAGAGAILAGQHPDWGPDQLKSTLIGSADPVDGDGYDVGAGRLDIGSGVSTVLQADRDAIDAVLREPRTEPHQETVTWTNHGDEPLTATFDARLRDRDGAEVGGISVEPAEVDIAPGEAEAVTVSIDGPNLDNGLRTGIVTARPAGSERDGEDGGPPSVRLPIGVYAAPELIDLTIEATAPGEVPEPELTVTFYSIVSLDDFAEHTEFGSFLDDSFTVSVPAGRYSVTGDVSRSPFSPTGIFAQVGEPDITVTEDTTVAFDGAAAVPIDPTLEEVDPAPPTYAGSEIAVLPERGTGGHAVLTSAVYSWYPMPPVHVTPMEADPEVFSARQLFRLQAPHLTAEIAGEPVDVTGVPGRDPAVGEHTLTAVDGGDGTDLTGAAGQLAVVRLPADPFERTQVIDRAAEAEVAVLAFVDEQRSHLTLDGLGGDDVPMVAAASSAASALLEAASAGDEVSITVAASPYVYDIVSSFTNEVVPDLVVDRDEQARLATLDEHFHRDPDGPAPTSERRYHLESLSNFDSVGPLPERRTAYVSADVAWLSMVFGSGHLDLGTGDPEPVDNLLVSGNAGQTYAPGEERTLTWLRRPQWPGPVGGPLGPSFCQPLPVARTANQLDVWLAPFQDDPDRYTCSDPLEAELTLERDGELVESVETYAASFEVPPEAADYTLTYEQEGRAPYDHRSQTTWKFRSAGPDSDQLQALIPLLVVDYDLPLDTLNRPTGRKASIVIDQVTGAEQHRVRPPRVWTSTDAGDTWEPARVRRADREASGRFDVTLPEVDDGTPVSLQVRARDTAGNRIEQTLYDAYTG